MREIKFDYIFKLDDDSFNHKKWSLNNLEFGDTAQWYAQMLIEDNINIIAKRQFTGLIDKKGVEIYEGDIVKACHSIDSNEIYQVEYGKGMFELNDIRNNDTFGEKGEDYYIYHRECISIPRYIEVIGNIYENNELLQ